MALGGKAVTSHRVGTPAAPKGQETETPGQSAGRLFLVVTKRKTKRSSDSSAARPPRRPISSSWRPSSWSPSSWSPSSWLPSSWLPFSWPPHVLLTDVAGELLADSRAGSEARQVSRHRNKTTNSPRSCRQAQRCARASCGSHRCCFRTPSLARNKAPYTCRVSQGCDSQSSYLFPETLQAQFLPQGQELLPKPPAVHVASVLFAQR